MSRVYELPTHLQVEDVLIAGLTARQLVRLMVGASLAYGLWDQTASFPVVLRLSATAALSFGGLLLALVRPAGRPLDQWLVAALLFTTLPHRRVWRRSVPEHFTARSARAQGWAELAPRPDWIGSDDDAVGAHTRHSTVPAVSGQGR